LQIHRSTDERGKEIREHTKTGSVRVFRIEPALRPLLNAMALESGGNGLVFSSVIEGAAELRRHLLRAGITRKALHQGTATSLAPRFHDLGAAGLRGPRSATTRRCDDATIEIRDRAGHADLEQTNDYMRRAAGVVDVGKRFPQLDALLGIVPTEGHKRRNGSQAAVSVVRRGGLEPPRELPR
jgi:integrase